MTSEVIIDVQPKDISIALLEDKQLVEYQQEQRTESFSVGNIYVAKVKKLMPGLNACFVDVGAERVAFLHYLDLGSQFYSYEKYLKQVVSDRKKLYPIQKAHIQPELKKDGSIATTLKVGQEILVQIVKEPINTKGPRLTCELSFAGRYLVLIPFDDSVSVSTKIKRGEERSRLKQLIQSIKPKNFGVIVRTVAEGKRAAELDAELKVLLKRWEDTITKVQKTTERPKLCFEEESRAVALLRDLFNPTYDAINVNDAQIFDEIKNYLGIIAPEKKEIVKKNEAFLVYLDEEDESVQYTFDSNISMLGVSPNYNYYVVNPSGVSRLMYPKIWKLGPYRTNTSGTGQPNAAHTRPFNIAKFSEFYFIAAEAAVKGASGSKSARDLVNVLRARAGKWAYKVNWDEEYKADFSDDLKAATPETITIDYLLDERMREYFGDGFRWFDLVRTQTWDKRAAKYTICGPGKSDHTPATVTRTIEKYHYLRPIPQGQLDNMKMEQALKEAYQNPGYPVK